MHQVEEEDAEPLNIDQRPLPDLLEEVIRLSARVGDAKQTMGILLGIDRDDVRRAAAEIALDEAYINQNEDLFLELERRDLRSRGDVRVSSKAGEKQKGPPKLLPEPKLPEPLVS